MPESGGFMPNSDKRQLGAAGAEQARDAEDLAGMHLEADVLVLAVAREVLDREHDRRVPTWIAF